MKPNRCSVFTVLVGAGTFLASVAILPAQLLSESTKNDSVVAIVADSQGLPLVPREELPWFGTFWVVRNSVPSIIAPLPCPPLNQTYPVYAISSRQFLVDETDGPLVLLGNRKATLTSADYAAIIEKQLDDLLTHVVWIQEAQLRAELRAMGLEGPPLPGGEGGEGGEGGPAFGPPSYGTNDLWLEILSMPVSNATAELVLHPPWNTPNAVYDLFSTTNLVPSWWNWVLGSAPGQTNLTITNLLSPQEFFILGLTNDLDGGGLSDAYEGLLGLDPNDASDDRLTPLVSIQATDSVAMEQQPANTASFLIERLGGHVTWPLTLAFQLSGTAVLSVNYTLTTADALTLTSSNLLVTIPAGQTNLLLTLTPVDDHVADGTKTVTLTLQPGSGWDVNPANASATAWILEQYTRVYTSVADFNQGVLDGLEAAAPAPNGQLQFKTNLPPQFPFINVACSDRGTVARIDTTNGKVIGEYRTAPFGLPSAPSPSRTTVDQYGNVWIANREDTLAISGTNHGSITRIGLIVGGSRFNKIGANYVSNPNGQYVALSNATYNTCIDRDGDGFIRTSGGLADILAWNNSNGVDSYGGVSTADDEAITEYTRVPSTGTRTIAVDKFNDVWVGGTGGNRTHLKVNGLLALVVPNSAFDGYDPQLGTSAGGYGGVIDALGNLWSSEGSGLMWLTSPTNLPPQQDIDWRALTPPSGTSPYGIAVDPLHPFIWQTSGDNVFRWHTDGTPETNATGEVILHPHGSTRSQGLAVDAGGHVWVAHQKDYSSTVGHLGTNGALIGVVQLNNYGLWAEYFGNTNLAGLPLTNYYEQTSLNYTNAWPEPPVPTNCFSARWSGTVQPTVQGDHMFYVEADAGAAFRLRVNGAIIIDNWTHPAPVSVELAGTNWLGTNIAYDIRLEYIHFTSAPLIKLSWMEPGMTREVIPQDRFYSYSSGATGISIDAAGKVWAGCYNSSSAVRIDPNAGPIMLLTNVVAGVTNVTTNHVGLVDMVVSLGDGTWHPAPYNQAAGPYNYSDMTGFNVRVVNPALQPLKGYWIAVEDSGNPGQLWNKVSWTADLTDGCSVEVYVRAADERPWLGSAIWVQATNDVFFPSIRGRYIEVRLAITRDHASKQPVVYDLTLYGTSSGFAGDFFLDDARAYETQDAVFYANLVGVDPLGYQWFTMYPWQTNWVQVPGATNSTFTVTNVDSWVDWTMASVLVSNGAGESLWLGPAFVEVWPLANALPISGSSGPASRYPATINVFDQPTNLNVVTVTISGLSHTRSADFSILLVSPSDKRIMLMSNVGGTNGVSGTTIRFRQNYSLPPTSGPIPSAQVLYYGPSNYGQVPSLPGAPSGPYSIRLDDLYGDNPNGTWKLYIYDGTQPGGVGQLSGSWWLDMTFQ